MSTLEEIDAKLEAIRKDPKYIALKNKQRKTPQDMEKFNAFLRQMGRLDAQRKECVAENKRNNVDATTYITAKPVWRNQPVAVAKKNQDAGKVAQNWVPENAVPLAEAHPEALKLTTFSTKNVSEPEPTPVPSTGRLMVHKLFRRKVVRTPNELKKMQERSANLKTPKGAPQHPRSKATHRIDEEPVVNIKPTTRRTAPPTVGQVDDQEEQEEQEEQEVDVNSNDEVENVSEENHDNVYEGELIDDLDDELNN